jgi:ABC transporter family protein
VRFGSLMGLAIVVGVLSSVAGLYLSFWLDVASGATIVLVQTGIFLVVLAVSPRTGLLGRRSRATEPVPVSSGVRPEDGRPVEPIGDRPQPSGHELRDRS